MALSCFGAVPLEQLVCAHIETIYAHSPELDRPNGVSNETLAEIVRNALSTFQLASDRCSQVFVK